MEERLKFKHSLGALIADSEIVIDRKKGSAHPRYPDYIYPLDYGYIKGTKSQDGGGIDVWVGSGDQKIVSGILVIFDPVKKDSEIKVLVGCNNGEPETALKSSNRGDMAAIEIKFNQGEII